ncbi:MAG TPA: hypothetical protein VFS67_32440 [Polyangiaceae bacterium]|nr:hypothetical protein [Polyangiaceae bacterium]
MARARLVSSLMAWALGKRCWLRLGVFCLVSSWAGSALADPRDVRLLPPALAPAHEPLRPAPGRAGALQPTPPMPPDLELSARRLEAVLHDALLDYGLSPLAALPSPAARDEESLVALARDCWVVSPELSAQGNELRLRLSVVAQGSSIVLVRAQSVDPEQLEVRSLGMLRELLEQPASLLREAPAASEREPEPALSLSVQPARSTGRVVLALHTAALGGYVGYSLQRASGSNDARLTYPLAALGAGIGVGAAMVVADEWDITLARAWFLGAAMLWPPVGISLASTRSGPDRHLLGVTGAVGGLTLATVGLAFGDVDDGGATFTHSGAVLGLLLGGLGEMIVLGDAQAKPTRGVGYGILAGVTLAGALATQIQTPTPTDMLSIDLSALLGGLAGAAIGTPLLVSQDPSERRDRIWLTGVMVGTVAGGVVGYYITRRDEAPAQPGAATDASVRIELGSPAAPLGFAISGEW